jgi:RNA polymerase sigma-70 factor (ECF subfamily)
MRAFRNDEFIAKIYSDAELRAIVIRVMRLKGVRKQDIEDCFNEVVRVALEKDEDLEAHPNIRAWLTVTARNIADNFLVKQSAIINSTIVLSEGIEITDPTRFEENIEIAEQEKGFLEFLKRTLTGADYELYVFKFIEYRSNLEIAALLREKKDTINKRVTRLKKKLKNIL